VLKNKTSLYNTPHLIPLWTQGITKFYKECPPQGWYTKLVGNCCIHTILQRRASTPYSKVERTSMILGHIGFLTKLKWSFIGRSSLYLLWPILYSEEILRTLMKPLLTPKHRRCHFVAYEWQWTSVGDKGDNFSSIDFWGSLIRPMRTTSNWKITIGGLFLSVKTNLQKKRWPCNVF
jgi:hypothetical protein